jgi:serine/threonine protein kinase
MRVMQPLRESDPLKVKDWTLQGRLGSGGTGVVYRGVDSNGLVAAIKVLRPELVDAPQVRERLRREADVLKRVRGGRTAEVFEIDADFDTPYIAMQLVEGESLNEFVEKNGTVKGAFAWAMVDALVDALRSIHAAGIIHRDLKPSNIMVGPDGVMVVDFGISVIQDAASSTQTGAMMGTVAWLSPEQITGDRATEQSDVFNLGMVLSYALTGRHPFGEGRPDAVMFRVAHGEPNLEGLPQKFEKLVESCLTKDPQKRPNLQAIELILSDVSKGDSSGENVGKVTDTLIVDRTMVEANARQENTSDDTQVVADQVVQLEVLKATNKVELKVLVAVIAVVAALIFFVTLNKSESDGGRGAIDEQVISSTSLESIVPATIPPTTIPVIPEFKLAEYEGRGVRFDPCDGPITIAVNFGTVSTSLFNNVTTWVTNAATDVSRESGLEFIFTGATDKVPKRKYRDGRNGSATILIGLLKPGESGATSIKKGETWGTDSFFSVGFKSSNSEWTPMESYDSQINADYPIFEEQIRRIFLQAIGLDTVKKTQYAASQELMAVVSEPDSNSFTWKKLNSAWGPGDILGMKAVGATNGCIG